jgi:predicted DNA-binding transcriptional regulator AlpA
MSDPLMDINDLARQVKIPVKTIRNKLSDGTWPIPPIQIGRALRWLPSVVDRTISALAQQKVADDNTFEKLPKAKSKKPKDHRT